MSFFTVDQSLCRKDGICSKVCPLRIIDGKVGEFPSMNPHHAKVCLQCGHCMAFCPANACVAPGVQQQENKPLHPVLLPTVEQVEELVFSRRSIRNFQKQPVPRHLLERLLDVARFAPTAKNTQQLRWIVLETRVQTEKLATLIADWLRNLADTDAATARQVHAESLVRIWDTGYDVLTRSAPQIALIAAPKGPWGASDAAIAATYLELTAYAHKVGCCWGGYVCMALGNPTAKAVREFLGVGDEEQVYAAQMLGYPKFAVQSRPPRKSVDVAWL